jgi:transcriptional regulator with XRE-family HTH domain
MARAALNWTVRDLAEATGLHRNTITNIEVGRYAGNQDSLEQIESVFRNGGIEFLADNGVRLLKPEVTKEGGADRESRRIAPRLRRRAGL